MTKKIKILIVILIVVIISFASWWLWGMQKVVELIYKQCSELETEISKEINSLNISCEVDSDCKPLIFGGNWINICVNKDTDTSAIDSAVKKFLKKCLYIGVYPPIECLCAENKCASVIEELQEVTITTDKAEYEQGEEVLFKVYGNIDICTNSLPFSILLNGSYVTLKHSCVGEVGSGFDQYCINGKIIAEDVRNLCDFSSKWCVGGCSDVITCWNEVINETFIWDQKEYIEITEECEGKTISREEKKQVSPGKYQIIVNNKVIKEFTIK